MESFLKQSLGALTSQVSGGQISDTDVKAVKTALDNSEMENAMKDAVKKWTQNQSPEKKINSQDVKNVQQNQAPPLTQAGEPQSESQTSTAGNQILTIKPNTQQQAPTMRQAAETQKAKSSQEAQNSSKNPSTTVQSQQQTSRPNTQTQEAGALPASKVGQISVQKIQPMTQKISNDAQMALNLNTIRQQARLQEGRTVDDQIDDDEYQEIPQRETVQEQTDAVVALAELKAIKKNLAKKRRRGKMKRRPTLITEPVGDGLLKGGITLSGYLITSLIGILYIAFGGIMKVLSQSLRFFFTPRTPEKPKKMSRRIKTKKAKRYFARQSGKITAAHNKGIRKDLKLEKTMRGLANALIQPTVRICAIVSGIILIIIFIMAIIIKLCDVPGVSLACSAFGL